MESALDIARQSRSTTVPPEHADFLQSLAVHRGFLRVTASGLTDEQAAFTPTTSALSIGGLIKHVTTVEAMWSAFMVDGAPAMQTEDGNDWTDGFRLVGAETLASVLDDYECVAERTTTLLESAPDLDVSHPLPEAPWFEPGASWSGRRVLLHIIAETAQHAGHADIIRETIDGSRTMG